MSVGAQLVLELGQALAGLAAAALGLFLDRGEGALAGVLVDVGDDVQREVEDPLEVARADVEQDAEPADGVPLKYQMWLTGLASWMWPIRSRRTLERVTSTPHLSQMMPL